MIKDQVKNTSFHKFSRQAARPTQIFTVVPSICGPLEWNLLHVTLLAPKIFRGSWICGKLVDPDNGYILCKKFSWHVTTKL